MPEKVRVGIVGCGAISSIYMATAPKFPILEVTALADLDRSKADARAKEYNIPRVLGVEELINDPGIDIVVNLTVPKAHAPVAIQSLEAGKHTYAEKPLATTREEGQKILDLAAKKKLRVGCAPDTFMGAGIQTARKVIDDGIIGRPVAFSASMLCRGHETWHPSPEFYYEVGGGPMFDMGPYYLTALLNLLGPYKRLSGAASIAIPERTITSQPKAGKKIKVETQDHVTGMIEFADGAIGTLMTSFATMHRTDDGKFPITIFGTEGTLRVPDPNGFDGPVEVRTAADQEWRNVPLTFHSGYQRMVGVADMAHAIRTGRPHRAGAEQAYTVLDMMQGFLDSSNTGKQVKPTVNYERPAAMPIGLPFGVLD